MSEFATGPDTRDNLAFYWIGGIALAAIYWVCEASIDTLFIENTSFAMRLLPSDLNELWMRSFSSVLLIGVALSAHGTVAGNRLIERIKMDAERDSQEARSRTISGTLERCSLCTKVRTQGSEWQDLRQLITTQTSIELKHRICQKCDSDIFSQ